MNYRKDIQILRGIAVLLVVLYHLGVLGFSSGFLGVDVFFVISGFLMAVLYDNDNKSLFFKRRSLRLLPAYFVTIIATLFASIFIVTPNEYTQVFDQALYADAFASNIGFWMQNSYFSKAEFNPLLHLWSLGVEIQFYIFIPLIFIFINNKKYIYILLLTSSLLLCFAVVGVSPKTSFFMMPLRLWEFLIGYGVAKYLTDDGMIRNQYSWVGSFFLLAVIAIPIFDVDGKAIGFVNGHPGIFAFIATVSTGMVLFAGLSRFIEDSIIGDFLELLGKYSYSIYLVHFPVIVLFLYEPFSGTNLQSERVVDVFVLVTITAILSFAMYHLVEVGLRKRKNIILLLVMSPLLVVLVAYAGNYIQSQIFTKKEMLVFNAFKDRSTYRCGKLFRLLNPSAITCRLTDTNESTKNNILLVGNSHADSIKTIFANVANSMDVGLYFLVPNTPLMKNSSVTTERIINEAKKHNVQNIVLHYSPNAFKSSRVIQELVTQARDKNIFVAYIKPVPTWDEHIPKALWDNIHNDKKLPRQTLSDYSQSNNDLFSSMAHIKEDNFVMYSVSDYLCRETCAFVDDIGKPLYFDDGHLTLTGSDKLSELFKIIISDGKEFNP